MKSKITMILLLLSIVIISGCIQTSTPEKPYITEVNTDNSYAFEGDTINVVVSITNPLNINYNGVVLIQADTPESPNCFGMDMVDIGTQQKVEGYLTTATVLSKTTNSVLMTMQVPTSNKDACYQPSNHKLNVFILQNGKVLDYESIDFSLFKKK